MIQNNSEEDITFIKYLLQPKPILDFFRGALYIMIAILFYMHPDFLTDLPLYKYLFCGAAMIYGLFRIYRIYADYKRLYR